MRVLFVCTGNSFRSPVAEALTRRYRPELEVESAGTAAVGHIAENAKEFLAEHDALQYVKPAPDQVSGRALNQASRVVAMTERHKKHILQNFSIPEEKIIVWGINDPITPEVSAEVAFREILENVQQL